MCIRDSLEDLLDPLGLLAARAHVDERAHDVAHHVLQEGIGLDAHADEAAAATFSPNGLYLMGVGYEDPSIPAAGPSPFGWEDPEHPSANP